MHREQLLRWAFRLEIATVSWNVLEGIVAVVAGVIAGSVALVGFGVDSFLETKSGAAPSGAASSIMIDSSLLSRFVFENEGNDALDGF